MDTWKRKNNALSRDKAVCRIKFTYKDLVVKVDNMVEIIENFNRELGHFKKDSNGNAGNKKYSNRWRKPLMGLIIELAQYS